jgi:hypothetical protein
VAATGPTIQPGIVTPYLWILERVRPWPLAFRR